MLGKLLKYDFKAAKIVLPFYGISALLLVILYALYSFDILSVHNVILNTIMGLLSALCVFSFIGVMLISVVYAVLHFGKHTIGAQAQVMFTLPITAGQFLASKLISSITVILAAFAYFMLTVFGFAYSMEGPALMISKIGPYEIGLVFAVIILMISTVAFSLLLYYLSVALSRHVSQNRVMGTIASYLVLSFVIQMLLLIVMAIAGAIAYSAGAFKNFEYFVASNNVLLSPLLVCAGFSVLFICIDTAMYFICRNQFSKKLNLP